MAKITIVLFSFLILISCYSLKTSGNKKASVVLKSICPQDGNCSMQLFENKSIAVKQDELGKTYYSLEDNKIKNVLLYSYSRESKDSLQDASYREEIVFEWPNSKKESTLSNDAIQNTKMLFGRFCFCKGQTGYYKVTNGTVTLKSNLKTQKGTINFKVDEVPQITKTIAFEIE